MNVVGIDPSLTATGVATAMACWTIKTRQKDGDRRLAQIHDSLQQILAYSGAELAVLEDLPTHAHSAGITGMVQGVVRLVLVSRSIPYALLPPATLKKYATGNGNADKSAMAEELRARADAVLGDDNQVDAWWLRAAGFEWSGWPLVPVPPAQSAALDGGKWPTPRAEAA